MLRNYLKTAWRSILRNKTTSMINVGGLTVGITAAVLILLWVHNELNFDNSHENSENIYRLTTNLKEHNWIWETTPLLLADAAKKEIPEIEKIARLYPDNWPVFTVNGKPTYEKKAAYIDDEWFNIFKYDFTEGNPADFKSNRFSIVLTESAAQKYFGNRKALGQTIKIDTVTYEVKAIVKDAPANSSFQYSAFLPLASLLADPLRRENDENWSNFNYITFIKLKAGSGAVNTAKKLTNILPGKEVYGTTISLTALKDMHFENDMQSSSFVHGNRNTVYIFSILAFLLLLIACINYVNLTTAKASIRAKEVSVRKMIGAKRIHLFYQLVAESVLISFIALTATLVLIQLCLPSFNAITGKNFQLAITSVSMWQPIGITLLVAILLNSVYPAILLSSFKPLNVFKGVTILRLKDSYFRKGLVVLQFTISVILIACTIVIYRQMQFVKQTDPGYNRSQVLSFPLPPGINTDKKELLMQTIKQELLQQSSIQNITTANQPIINIGSVSTGSADWDGHDTTFNPKITQLSADADFQKTMQLQMKEGRWFGGNPGDKNNVVLNEAAIAQLNIPAPVIGQRFTFKQRTGQIIGVVKDFNYQSLHDKTGPLIAFNDPQWFRFFMVRIAPGKVEEALAAVHNTWNTIVPGHPLEYKFLDDSFNSLYKEDQQASFLILVFAIIAVVISCLGLFGLAAFTAERRTKEIGIRKVLGATVTGITTLLSKDFIRLVSIAILIATPIALWALNKWIENFAYRITISWWMFAAAGLLALSVAVITTSFQAIKAAIANPVKSLRTE